MKPPSVLVVLVVKDGEAWLPQCLMGLARQTHPRIGILAVDEGSADRSADLLESALGAGRVTRLPANVGFGAAVTVALGSEAAQQADFVLLLHDDTLLEPDAVAEMVEAADRIDGAGVVGPKVLDWEHPQVLREVGLATDRFAYPYSPLEDGEIDQGQYDRVREVMYVSSCAMLLSRQAWARVGMPDERLPPSRQDIDFCWRARLAGFRVLMTPKAVVRHGSAGLHGERPDEPGAPTPRYDLERGALASILKNYGLLSLLWILPLYLIQGLIRLLVLTLSRRFQDAYQLLAAWGWNVAHLPGTIRRRVRAQAIRSVPDRSVRRAMAPTTIPLRRWAQAAGQGLMPHYDQGEEAAHVGGLRRAAAIAGEHPAATAWVLGILSAAVAYRHLVGASPLTGGGLGAAFPASPSAFFNELASGISHTGLGGSTAASPALGLLGGGSVLALGSPALFEKLLLLSLPALAAIGCYRAVRALTLLPVPSVVAAVCYGLSSAVLWGLSEGRIPALVFLAGVPWIAGKLGLPFDDLGAIRARRWVIGAGLGLAILASFYPGAVLAAGVFAVSMLLVPPVGGRRVRGVILTGLALAVAAILMFPTAVELARSGLAGMRDLAGEPSFPSLARLSLGPGPGSWVTGLFLPGAAAFSFLFVAPPHRTIALRAGVAAILSIYLAWFAAAGYLPAFLSNPVAYVGVATFSCALLVGLGLASLLRGVGRTEFGVRQLGTAVMAGLLAVGILGQLAQAGRGSWSIGGSERVPAAYPLAGEAGGPLYRVLWIGSPGGDAFPAPGGLPAGTVAAGDASIRFGITGQTGASALDIGRPAVGPGYERLRRSLAEVLIGQTRHGGALLATFGIRFLVADSGDLPGPALRRLIHQVDLDVVATRGLTILRNDMAVPLASEIGDTAWYRAAGSPDLAVAESIPRTTPRPLLDQGAGERLRGPRHQGTGLVLLLSQFDPGWRLEPAGATDPADFLKPKLAFGWATGFRVGTRPSATGTRFTTRSVSNGYIVRFTRQPVRTGQTVALLVLWGAALWFTRRPARHG